MATSTHHPQAGRATLHWVDVFATGPLSGNPLVVVMSDKHPSEGRMQALAAEMGLSETVFAAPGERPRIRIFTPLTEIPLAGHPIVGAAWVLANEGWIGTEAVLSAPGGDIPVHVDNGTARMTQPTPRHVGDVDAAAVARTLGCHAQGTVPIWHTGLPQVMLAVPEPADVRADHEAVRALGEASGWAGVSAYAIRDRTPGALRVEVRHFAAPIGIPEDPVTGSAAGALGAALAAAGHGNGGWLDMVVSQGANLGRPGEVRVRVHAPRGRPRSVEVGGAVVPVLTGTLLHAALAG